MLDPAVAEAAFAAEPNTPVAVTEGALQPSVIRVTAIEPGSVPTLEEIDAAASARTSPRAPRATSVQDLYDQVEDERAGGATLEEAATKLSLPYRVVDAVSADLKAPDGSTVSDIPGGAQVVKEAFDSDVGVENSPIRAGADSWVFYRRARRHAGARPHARRGARRGRRRRGPRRRRRSASPTAPTSSSSG